MEIASLVTLSAILITALTVNLPLGYLRQGSRRYSAAWFLYIHLSIPLIVALRLAFGFGWDIVPLTVACAVAGQIIGGRIFRRRHP